MRHKLLLIGMGICVVILGAVAMTYAITLNRPAQTDSSAGSTTSLIDKNVLNSLPKADRAKADTSRLAEGMIPPTNTWFSGLALQASPEPAYSYPNSFQPTQDGFELGLPSVTAAAETIMGPHTADVSVSFSNATIYKITRYDELTIDLTYYDSDGAELAAVTIAAGSPYVYVSATKDLTLSYTGTSEIKEDATAITANGKLFGLKTEGTAAKGPARITAGSQATFFSSPDSVAFKEIASYASNSIQSGSVRYTGNNSASATTLSYKTHNNKPTLIARLPHQRTTKQPAAPVEYDSILGTLTTTVSETLEYEVPRMSVNESLTVSSLSRDQKELLIEQLQTDTANLPEPRTDTYFGGKQLQRTAQLLELADQLGAQSERDKLQDSLKVRLTQWLRADGAFEYDSKIHAIVGKETSFGADTDVNDHHFHYGYAIYAAAVLAKFDGTFMERNKTAVNLLVADIANYAADEALPLRRNYDPYFGHSWASGTSPFKDGNNQESTSEAMNAWTAVALWAKQTKNTPLEEQAVWMLSNETAAAKEYWLKKPTIDGYVAPLVSIVWGGKREYKTFFSDDPNAKLAILILPLNPSMRDYAAAIPKTAFTGTDTSRPFGDYLVMANPDSTVEQARKLPDTAIDDGNSRTYMYAYIMTR